MASIENARAPRIGILMINRNQWKLTRNCIDCLMASKGVNICIGLVDNASADETPDWVKAYSNIFFHRNLDNAGFIAGNIKAFEMVVDHDVDYVMLLNNDTEAEPNMLRLLVDQFERCPETGLATPAITYAENREIIWHAGGAFIPWKMGTRQLYETVHDLPEEPVQVDQISGCAMMMRPDMFRRIGYQDPDLFIYHEDVEQSLKSIQLGYRNYLVPSARLVHYVSITVGGVLSPFAVYFTHRNRCIFASRNLRGKSLLFFRLYYIFVTIAKTVIYPLKGNGDLVYWMWLAFFHGFGGKAEKRPEGLFR